MRMCTEAVDDIKLSNAARPHLGLFANVRAIRFAAGTAVAIDLALGIWSLAAAWAPEAPRATITVQPVTRAQPSSMTQLSIQVGPQETLPKNSFIRIRG